MSNIRLRLDDLLRERKMTRYRLSQLAGVQYQTMDRYYKNQVTRYDRDFLLRVCKALDCGVEDVIEIKKD